MKTKKIIKSLIYILVILFIFLVIFLYKYKNNNENNFIIKDDNNNSINYNQIDTENIYVNNIGLDNPSIIEIDEANPDKIDYEGQIKRIKLSISNVSKELQEYIKDKESFAYSIKKYFYESGLLDGDIISLLKSEMQNDDIIMYFKLNNNSSTILKVVYNSDQNTTKVSEQK